MTTSDIHKLEGFTPVVDAEKRDVEKVWCGDLLSWAMGYAPADCAWCTIMGNINAVAVASLADVATIVLCEDAQLDDDAQQKASAQGINIIKTSLPAFEAGLAIARAGGLYPEK